MKKFGILFGLLIFAAACSNKVPQEGDNIIPTDYSIQENWLNIPFNTTKPVDVFYIYPTAWKGVRSRFSLCDINYPEMRYGAQDLLNSQASAFQSAGNIYAPYYRQLEAGFILNKNLKEQNKYIKGAPKADIMAAFDYYIKNHNQGRPFILVGHSQGAAMVKELLTDYLKNNSEVYSRMVAAYVIGWSITNDDLIMNPHLKFAQSGNDTGVVISYNTEAPNFKGKNPAWQKGAIAINPITWTRGSEATSKEQSLGSMIIDGSSYNKVMNLVDAKVNVERGVIECSSINPETYKAAGDHADYFPKGVYHTFDIAFYYYNLRQNAEDRVKSYLSIKEVK